jgi:membrane protease YdiL (CAAX protease family)
LQHNPNLKKLGFAASCAIYTGAALLMFVSTRYLIPYMSEVTGQETILCWFVVAGLGIFLPLLITAYYIIKAEGFSFTQEFLLNRLRFKRITRKDLIWSLAGLVVAGLMSTIIMKAIETITGAFDHAPSFMTFEPLTSGRYWLLLVWLPYWILNIMGEEILWRGVMLPRQEVAFGNKAWIIHGTGWMLFHIAFGWQLLITLIPLIFILSFIVQKTKNSWNGVIMHAGLNGPSFIAIALGWI